MNRLSATRRFLDAFDRREANVRDNIEEDLGTTHGAQPSPTDLTTRVSTATVGSAAIVSRFCENIRPFSNLANPLSKSQR